MRPIKTSLQVRFAGEALVLIIGIAIAIGALFLTAHLSRTINGQFGFLQYQTARARVDSVLQSLDLRLRQTVYLNRPISHWDDTYQYALGKAPNYPQLNYNDEAMRVFPFNALLIYDNRKDLLFSVYENEDGKTGPVPDGMEKIITWPAFRDLSGADDVGYAFGAFGGRVFLLCATRISNSNGTADSPGTYITGFPVNAKMEEDIRLLTGVTVHITAVETASVRNSEMVSLPQLGSITVHYQKQKDGEHQRAEAYLKTGTDTKMVRVAMEFPLRFSVTGEKLASNVRSRFYIIIAAFGVLVVFLLVEMIRRSWELQERIRDKEQAERLARAAAEADEAKSAFLAMMSHELRTPLNAVLGFSELMTETKLSEEQEPYMQMIHGSGTALLALINDILDLSRIEAGKMPIEVLPVKVRPFLDEIALLFRKMAEEAGDRIVLEISDDAPEIVYTDPLRLRQIISNFVSNAIKYTTNGSITITASSATLKDFMKEIPETITDAVARGERLFRITVQDTGSGIPPHLQQRLFQPFTQADSSTTRRHGGTGLGLAISRRLSKMMGGNVWYEPGAPGSRFVLMLPEGSKALVKNKNGGLPAPQVSSLMPQGSLDILVVEDNPINAKLMLTMLNKCGIDGFHASNGGEALAFFAEHHPSLIFMDIQMPGMDGFEATRRIRAMEKEQSRPRACIIALTAEAMEGIEDQCTAAGMDGYLSKPIHRSQIAEAIQRCRHVGGSREA